MITRSEIRHACYRAKNNAATEKNLELLSIVEPLLHPHQRWENFADVWDIIYTNGEVKSVSPEVDLEYIKTVCQEKSIEVKYNIDEASIKTDERKENVITIVESKMLDGKMTWENYGQKWGVEIDPVLKAINTKLYHEVSQKAVTVEMIEASKISLDSAPYIGEQAVETEMEAKPMTPEQQAAFEAFLAKSKE